MTHGEREIQRLIIGAFRDAAAHGGFICASELFGYDSADELSERYMIDAGSVPSTGPVSVVIYNLDEQEAWEIELSFTVRDVAAQPHYVRIFNTHNEKREADSAA